MARAYSNLTDQPTNLQWLVFNGTTLQWEPQDINDLTAVAPDSANDFFVFYDVTDGLHKKALISTIAGGDITVTGDGAGTTAQTISTGDTLTLSGAANTNVEFEGIATDGVEFQWKVAPTTGGTTQQVMIFNDNTDAFSWGDPIVIAAGSSSYLSYDNTTRELSVSNLLITDVTVEGTSTTLAAYVATTPTHEAGDVIILTAATGGTETYIISGADGSVAGNYTLINDATAITGLTLAADTGTSETIVNGDTITIAGATTSNLQTVVSATDTVTTEFIVKPTTGGATKQVLQFNDTGDVFTWEDVTTLAGFTLAADTGTSEVVDADETVTIAGGVGLTSAVSATNTVTISHAFAELTNTIPLVTDSILFFDDSAADAPVSALMSDITSFTLAADTGTAEVVKLYDTVSILGGKGISTVVSATDTVTVSTSLNVVSQTASYTAAATDDVVLVTNTTAGATVITIPSAIVAGSGATITVRAPQTAALFANTLTIASTAGTLDGAATIQLFSAGSSMTFVSDGSAWWSIA